MTARFTGQKSPEVKPYFKAALRSDGTLEIVIYEEIGEDFWSYDGGVTAKTVKQQIDQAPNAQKILLRINSPGGDAFEGIAIYNLLRSVNKPVDVCIDGVAASSASIIAMAGDTITMGPNTLIMIHNAWGWASGYAEDMRKMADTLEKLSGSIAQTYAVKTGKSTEEIQALMNAETWMTAQECLDAGFCTAVTSGSDQEIEETALALARKFKSLTKMKHVPERLKNAACDCTCKNCAASNCAGCTVSDCDDLNCLDCPMQAGAQAKPRNSAGAKTKKVDGEDLTWSDFIVVIDHDDPSTWHLPYKFASMEKTKSHLRDALARFDQVQGLSKDEKHAAWAKLVRLCKQYGIEVTAENRAKFAFWAKAEGVCACDCDNCLDGYCQNCSNRDCVDENCDECPMQEDGASAERAKLQLQLMKLKSSDRKEAA